MAAAKRFKIDGLVGLCEDYLIDTLDPSDAVSKFCFAQEIGSPRLEYCSLAVMALHLEETMQSKAYPSLDADSCRRLLALSHLTRDGVVSTLSDELALIMMPPADESEFAVKKDVDEPKKGSDDLQPPDDEKRSLEAKGIEKEAVEEGQEVEKEPTKEDQAGAALDVDNDGDSSTPLTTANPNIVAI